jgi:hypothetical protein
MGRPKDRRMRDIPGAAARYFCAHHLLASKGLPALPAPHGVVEVVVSTACRGARRDEHRYTDWGSAREGACAPFRGSEVTALCDR